MSKRKHLFMPLLISVICFSSCSAHSGESLSSYASDKSENLTSEVSSGHSGSDISAVSSSGSSFDSLSFPSETSFSSLDSRDFTHFLSWGGARETAFAQWIWNPAASGYNAYYQKAAGETWTKIDSELIRKYSDYARVDAIGLTAGLYQLKAVPIFSGALDESQAIITDPIQVEAYRRDGYAFKNGTASGAYNEDGSLKADAVVLYITPTTKDTITADIITSSKGTKTSATGLQGILDLIKKGYDTRSFDFRLIGNITDPAVLNKGDIVIDGSSKFDKGITFEGIGNDATVNGWGLRIKGGINVEVRNLGFMNCNSDEGDSIGLQQDNKNIWVHNCDLFYGASGSDADQIKGDGALDTKKSTDVTLSFNHFWDNGKCNLLGLSESEYDLYITYDHNWYDHSDSRHPRVRYFNAHVYNNYYDGNAKYGIAACKGCSVFAQGNYFRHCKYPMLTSMQGSDYNISLVDGKDVLSSEDGGNIKAFDNIMVNQTSFIDYKDSNTSFDAYSVTAEDEKIPETVVAKQTGSTWKPYSNFDTDASLKDSVISIDKTEDVPAVVSHYAGRVQGGDLKWAFDNTTEDSNSDVIPGLRAALVAYKGSLSEVGGHSI
jgi:pectate lyase